MKRTALFFLPGLLVLAACDAMKSSFSGEGYDPLGPPGGNAPLATAQANANLRAGEYAQTSMDGSAFFRNRPDGAASADRMLDRGERLKVISTDDVYVKVELDNGEVGYIPGVMVEDPKAAADTANAMQIYPPVAPVIPQDELPPGGFIPTVIDPETMPAGDPLPTLDSAPDPSLDPTLNPSLLDPDFEPTPLDPAAAAEAEKKIVDVTPPIAPDEEPPITPPDDSDSAPEDLQDPAGP